MVKPIKRYRPERHYMRRPGPKWLEKRDGGIDRIGPVIEDHRGYKQLLTNFCFQLRRIWVASYDFQAPGMYEKAGFKRVAEFSGWPEGHSNVVLCKTLIA
jgi:hypothetical protein